MKKGLLLLILLLICLALTQGALAERGFCDPVPQEIAEEIRRRGEDPATIQDCVLLSGEGMEKQAFVLGQYGYSLDSWEWNGSAWQSVMQTSGLDYGDENAYFSRHEAGQERVPGLPWPDGRGFDIVSPRHGVVLSFHWQREGVEYAGWVDPEAWDGLVAIDWNEGTLSYYRMDGTLADQVRMEDERQLSNCVWYFPRKPGTPEEARKRTQLNRSELKDVYPGWTMGLYDLHGTMADTMYFRVEGNDLLLRCASFDLERKPVYRDLIPVPVKKEAAKKLAAGEWEELLQFSYGANLLRDPSILDRERVPVEGEIIEMDVQERCMVIQTRQQETYRLYTVWQREDGQYAASRHEKMPEKFSLDTFHASEGELLLRWDSLTGGYLYQGEGEWRLSWLMTDSGTFTILPWGIRDEEDRECFGRFPWLMLSSGDIQSMPTMWEKMAASLSTEGLAMVNNPDPKDRLHLRDEAKKDSPSAGKFWNRTPVQVLERRGDWTRVRVGWGKVSLEGWMMTEYLAFGDAMASVKAPKGVPQLCLREEYEGKKLFWDKNCQRKSDIDISLYNYEIIGVFQDAYIVMLRDGSVGYVPTHWLWEGNG